MLDLRPFEQFQKIHLKDSTHFPIRYLNTTMMSSLPPRFSGNQIYNELILVGNKCQIEEAENHFKERDWKVKKSIIVNDDKDFLDLEKNNYQLEKNTGNNYKGKRLWKANQVLEQKIEEIEDLLFQNTHKKTKIENEQDQNSNKTEKQKFKAIDLGCGRGRDTIFLATRNWFIQAIDNQQAFINALNFWSAEENLQDNIKTIIQDFKKEIQVDSNQDLYIFSRFMNNNLLDEIIKNCKKGAFILVNHFLEGQSQNRKGKQFKNQHELINQQFFEKFGIKNYQQNKIQNIEKQSQNDEQNENTKHLQFQEINKQQNNNQNILLQSNLKEQEQTEVKIQKQNIQNINNSSNINSNIDQIKYNNKNENKEQYQFKIIMNEEILDESQTRTLVLFLAQKI